MKHENVRVRVIANYNIEDFIEKMTPNGSRSFNNVIFGTDINNPDAVLVINYPNKTVKLETYKEMIYLLFQEPGNFFYTPYMHYVSRTYSKVFTHVDPLFANRSKRQKVFIGPVFLPWHIEKNYDDLVNMKKPDKPKKLSCISSNKKSLPGHILRYKFVNYLIEKKLECDYYGKGMNFVKDKFDALSKYKYSIAIENCSKKDYFTEKLTDCFLSYTVPIYYGCTNLKNYFPENSFIQIDIRDKEKAYKKIVEIINNDNYESRIQALEKARELVLKKYNLFYHFSSVISDQFKMIDSTRTTVIIKKPSRFYSFSNNFLKILYKSFIIVRGG
ncbi:glycosyltransferase family 10 domain-containing protein [Kosmotoga sp. DU53]|uniref:glycosyltransferase family 10 domain-containing protein n=1 Tax=Kosmotoga sp. DU53 TaxID=1310160 RepID=UPI0007C5CE62|nr:glycosyltransferase family 10 [Kosmotoga sp. DU53]